jgi:hypothetical protein
MSEKLGVEELKMACNSLSLKVFPQIADFPLESGQLAYLCPL